MTDLLNSFSTLISIVIGFGAGIAVLFIVIGAVKYQTASGNPQRMESAKTTVIAAIGGLILMMVAFPTVNMITSTVGETPGAIQVQQVAGTDTQRLDAPRVVSVVRLHGDNDSATTFKAVAITFTEPVTVTGTVRLATDRGSLTLKTSGTANSDAYSNTPTNTTPSIVPTPTNTLTLHFGWGDSDVDDSSDPEIVAGTEVRGIIFERGAEIRDSDNNNALVAFDRIQF